MYKSNGIVPDCLEVKSQHDSLGTKANISQFLERKRNGSDGIGCLVLTLDLATVHST